MIKTDAFPARLFLSPQVSTVMERKLVKSHAAQIISRLNVSWVHRVKAPFVSTCGPILIRDRADLGFCLSEQFTENRDREGRVHCPDMSQSPQPGPGTSVLFIADRMCASTLTLTESIYSLSFVCQAVKMYVT